MTGGWSRASSIDPVRPVINVTPLVDVVLVLLIIFMVVAPQLEQDVSVVLPGVFNADPEGQPASPFKVSVPRPGEYYYEAQRYDLDGITATLEAEHAADPLRRLLLRADARLRYGDVRELQRRLQEVGFPGASFMVGERHRWEEPAVSGEAPSAAADASPAEMR
jgi:biopolymer transport protein ExbD